jgi:hypothetical protein
MDRREFNIHTSSVIWTCDLCPWLGSVDCAQLEGIKNVLIWITKTSQNILLNIRTKFILWFSVSVGIVSILRAVFQTDKTRLKDVWFVSPNLERCVSVFHVIHEMNWTMKHLFVRHDCGMTLSNQGRRHVQVDTMMRGVW